METSTAPSSSASASPGRLRLDGSVRLPAHGYRPSPSCWIAAGAKRCSQLPARTATTSDLRQLLAEISGAGPAPLILFASRGPGPNAVAAEVWRPLPLGYDMKDGKIAV